MEFLLFMAAPIVMCLVLVGIHVQLGLHVVRRGVIFVDIALAQSSALGAGIAAALGADVGTPLSGAAGLAMALLAAWIISLTRSRKGRVPQEAFIGITYVVAAAATILVLARLPHGGEDIETLLVGSILWVSWNDVLRTAILYGVLGALLFVVRRPVHLVSEDPERAWREGIRVRWWDFVFYAILGVVVTWSVQIAGVFLVFTFLVVPAVMAVLIGGRHRMLLGWLLGSVIAAAGASASYALDFPTGATIVCAFGLGLMVVGAAVRLFRGEEAVPEAGS
jgi:zinc/manganese transport system permease protein